MKRKLVVRQQIWRINQFAPIKATIYPCPKQIGTAKIVIRKS